MNVGGARECARSASDPAAPRPLLIQDRASPDLEREALRSRPAPGPVPGHYRGRVLEEGRGERVQRQGQLRQGSRN